MKRFAVLISGSGTNLQAMIDACATGHISGQLAVAVSNKASAFGLERARRANIPTEVVDHQSFASREAFDEHFSAA